MPLNVCKRLMIDISLKHFVKCRPHVQKEYVCPCFSMVIVDAMHKAHVLLLFLFGCWCVQLTWCFSSRNLICLRFRRFANLETAGTGWMMKRIWSTKSMSHLKVFCLTIERSFTCNTLGGLYTVAGFNPLDMVGCEQSSRLSCSSSLTTSLALISLMEENEEDELPPSLSLPLSSDLPK